MWFRRDLRLADHPALMTAATDHVKDTLQEMQLNAKKGADKAEASEAVAQAHYFQQVAEIDLLVNWVKERDMGYKVFEVFKVNYFTLKSLLTVTSTIVIAMQTAGAIVGQAG